MTMNGNDLAKPLHLQRLEAALRLDPFLDYVEHVVNQPISDDDSESEDDDENGKKHFHNGVFRDKEERVNDRSHAFNLSGVRRKREWLKDLLLSSTSSSSSSSSSESSSEDSDCDSTITQKHLDNMLREHRIRKHHQSHFYQNEENRGYLYYGAGLLSRVDKYPEHQRFMAGSRRKKKKENEKLKKLKIEEDEEDLDRASPVCQNEDSMQSFPDDASDDLNLPIKSKGKGSKREKKPKKLDAQALAMRRHKLWVLMAKKEVGRCQKNKVSQRKETLTNCKRMATGCMRVCRQKALQSQKTVKDKIWMLKRLTRTMQGEWKKFDRIMKEQNRRAEKEAEEQRKMDKEILEVKRQQRKVNFLITLPELYAHFMKSKDGTEEEVEQDADKILKNLDEDTSMPKIAQDDYDCEAMKQQALKTAKDAFSNQQSRLNVFNGEDGSKMIGGGEQKEFDPPKNFHGTLKSYQLKGMNWLANLFYFGINGILADEMGLGKTVQTIAFLGHVCEVYDMWGPFLIITPASTLHNWMGEINRFCPDMTVVPYWGNPEERKSLRKFFDGKNIGTKESSFHVVITSYQIVIQDFKFLNRLKWNYMVLDEAQAIKSINSQRWKILLGFSCRNRLLLSGTPIQNSMAELWALLHFIMPTLFDSHNWFNEWFSKDIEGHIENKTHVDEKHLNRLHMILKPFMLRRVKTEVENELSDKIEIMMYCPMTLRQRFLYSGLKNKISIDELLRSASGSSTQQSSVTTSLMNLVMQFRKVCNHPELLERREVRSPYTMRVAPHIIPKLIYREGILENSILSRDHLLFNTFSVFHPENINESLKSEKKSSKSFSFLRFIDTSPGELSSCVRGGIQPRWLLLLASIQYAALRHHRNTWHHERKSQEFPRHKSSTIVTTSSSRTANFGRDSLLLDVPCYNISPAYRCGAPPLVFTSRTSTLYTFTEQTLHHMPETLNHRIMRSKHVSSSLIQVLSNVKTDIKTEPPDLKDESLSTEEQFSGGENEDVDIEDCEDDKTKIKIEGNVGSPVKLIGSPLKSSRTGGGSSRSSHRKTQSNSRKKGHTVKKEGGKTAQEIDISLLPEFPHTERPPVTLTCQETTMPQFLMQTCGRAKMLGWDLYATDRSCAWQSLRQKNFDTAEAYDVVHSGSNEMESEWQQRHNTFRSVEVGGLRASRPRKGWNHVVIPDKHTLIMDAGKLYVLDILLTRLKAGGHRVLIYSQMTKMIDVLEEFMWHRKHKYMRLDGSSKISDRRDMVENFQTKMDIFVFLLSTRAGGVGINLTAADTVIFYDSDWNPTVDAQAMDRAHRLGQTKQVTVYRLVCKGTIEERILQRATEKSQIQRMVISGGNFKVDTLRPKEVVSLLLDDDIEKQYRLRQAERKILEEQKIELNREKMRERMRKRYAEKKLEREIEDKRKKGEDNVTLDVVGDNSLTPLDSMPSSPTHSDASFTTSAFMDDASNDSSLVVDVESPVPPPASSTGPGTMRGQRKRGRPKGSGGSIRQRLGRGGENQAAIQHNQAVLAAQALVNMADGSDVVPVINVASSSSERGKRGRGRPRLLPMGPGHQGTRTPPALPLALGSNLNQNPQQNDQKPFGYYT